SSRSGKRATSDQIFSTTQSRLEQDDHCFASVDINNKPPNNRTVTLLQEGTNMFVPFNQLLLTI
ncbi:MAG: hypothetical protein KDK05_06485, partial [Candidatus Competibacteraceae bacterium]|nr:hypothetical protein [Candidatus Competibacteraceae bacterium]